ncbi:hotdog fold thioesterase [Allokutzneria sp. NRRL B-24872]|uniref:hotdog fold thioesterase n=1 Tax=Allokutzneria sp. NRRL B-24872 TaxID=1137961 RepID=UPI000A38C63A
MLSIPPSPQGAPVNLPAAVPNLVQAEQLTDKLGIEITEWNAERLVGTMPVAGNRQPYGLLHGGASAAFAETLGSIAAVMNAGEGRIAVGLELSCTHHRAAREGVVTGVCTPLHVGRTTATFEIAITDESGKRVCTARLTCVVRDAPPGEKAR